MTGGRQIGPAGRTIVLNLMGVLSGLTMVVVAVVGLRTAGVTSGAFADRTVPAERALQSVSRAASDAQAALLATVHTQDPTARSAHIAAAQAFRGLQAAWWTSYLARSFDTGPEPALQRTYEASATRMNQLAGEIMASAPAPAVALVAAEVRQSGAVLDTVAALQSRVYLPLLQQEATAVHRGVGRGRRDVEDSYALLAALFSVVGLWLMQGARRDQKRLRTSEERFRTLAASAPVGIFLTNPHGQCTYVNQAWTAITGLSSDDAMGYGWGAMLHPDERDDARSSFLRSVATGQEFARRSQLSMADGAVRWTDARAVAVHNLHDRANEFGGFVGTLTDVSSEVQAQASIATARDQALAASRMKSDFLATMSHEIRTPMNGVIGLTGLLLDTELTDIQRHHAEGVRASGEALMGIINEILDFSKIEAGKLELESVDFDLGQAIEDVAALVAESARAKDLELVAYCRPDAPTSVRGDVGRLRQILLNFATNAVKFTETGEVVIRAMLDSEAVGDTTVVRFEVADTGIGIDPDSATQMFEAFSQFDASTTRRYGGTGLGLAICRRLAAAMGGTVGVDSRPGEGSTFWACLPFAPVSMPLPPRERSSATWQGRRVLVVDDNETNRLALASQLSAWNVHVEMAGGADEALQRLWLCAARADPFDVALLDLAMPGMDGLELAKVVRSDPALADLRMVLMSSAPLEQSTAIEAGFSGCLVKPLRPSALCDTMAQLFGPTWPDLSARPSPPAVVVGSAGTVLIVEDNVVNQEVAKGMVAGLGYGSDVAANGLEALQALERRRYDAVLMDCFMPEMDGFQATTEIRRREAGGAHVPIVAMTAGALVEDRDRCITVGMDEFLSKPVTARELGAALDRCRTRNRASSGDENGARGAFRAGADNGDPDGVVLDADQFDGLRQVAATDPDPNWLDALVEEYLRDASCLVTRVGDALAARGPDLRQAAHILRGSSGMMGAHRLETACGLIERTAKQGGAVDPSALAEIEANLADVAFALRAEVTTFHRPFTDRESVGPSLNDGFSRQPGSDPGPPPPWASRSGVSFELD